MEAFLSGSGLFNLIIQLEGFFLSEIMSEVQGFNGYQDFLKS